MRKLTNGRVAVEDSMPALADACPGFKGFAKGEKRTDGIVQMLREVIQRYRSTTPKRFYTVREVAKYFGVSLCTVETAYHRLNRDGVLTRVRSSQTMIAARAPRPKFAVRGVVCMPIYLPGFINFREWRSWFSELEEELSRHRFVLEPVFFQYKEEGEPAFVDRVLKFNPDYVVWSAPAHTARMTMESIIDAGVPILSILGHRNPSLPGRIYRTSLERALRQGLKEWKAGGQIDRIVIPCIIKGEAAVLHNFGALQASPLPYEFKPYHSLLSTPEYLANLAPDRRTGIFFGDSMLFIRLCGMATEEMFQLFRRHRVIFPCQVMMQSWTIPNDIFVDWLVVPNRQLTRRIAEDLSQSKGALPSSGEVFEAVWRPHTPLAKLARCYVSE